MIWDVAEMTAMDHPFRLPAAPRLGWKDTVNVPRMSTVQLAMVYGPLGRWLYHCHILEHAERGMMGELSIVVP